MNEVRARVFAGGVRTLIGTPTERIDSADTETFDPWVKQFTSSAIAELPPNERELFTKELRDELAALAKKVLAGTLKYTTDTEEKHALGPFECKVGGLPVITWWETNYDGRGRPDQARLAAIAGAAGRNDPSGKVRVQTLQQGLLFRVPEFSLGESGEIDQRGLRRQRGENRVDRDPRILVPRGAGRNEAFIRRALFNGERFPGMTANMMSPAKTNCTSPADSAKSRLRAARLPFPNASGHKRGSAES